MPKDNERREFLKFLVTSGIVLSSTGSVGTLLSGCKKGQEIDVETIYDFLDHLDEAEVITPKKDFVKRSSLTIQGEEKGVLFEHPDSQVAFAGIPLYRNAHLRFGIGISEAAWDKAGNGVQFAITLVDERSGKHSIYSRYIDPKNSPEDRNWFDEIVDLKDFEGQSVSFTFATSTGPKKDNSFDWAGWSNPVIGFTEKKTIREYQHTNIIFITLDTTRADHLSCYGYQRKTTPNLDKIAQKGMQFLNAISPSSWTLPAHASLFTSLYPSQHGAITRADEDVLSGHPLGESDFVLARMLQKHGFETAGFMGASFLKSQFGFSQGFDTYDDKWEEFDRRADQINAKVFSWLGQNLSHPFFLFINYFDPHSPYNPPRNFQSPFEQPYDGDIDFATFGPHQIKTGEVEPLQEEDKKRAIDLYDTEILFMDYQVGRLLQKLEELRLLDNSLIIITSDHGESFGENSMWGHGGPPIESQIRVPLILHYPHKIKRPNVIRGQVQTNCIYATILKTLDIPLPSHTVQTGVDTNLLNVDENRKSRGASGSYTFSERFTPKRSMRMLRSNKRKYILIESGKPGEGKRVELVFNLDDDPHEGNNLLGQDETMDNLLREAYSAFVKKIAEAQNGVFASSATSPAALNDEMRRKLKALGYVQ